MGPSPALEHRLNKAVPFHKTLHTFCCSKEWVGGGDGGASYAYQGSYMAGHAVAWS